VAAELLELLSSDIVSETAVVPEVIADVTFSILAANQALARGVGA
jgi:hypothetical protein